MEPVPKHRRTIAADLALGETRGSNKSCEVFHVSCVHDPVHQVQINKRLMMALCDLPLQCAANVLGLHKSCLVRIRDKFDLKQWPYKAVMRGEWPVMSKEEVVLLRDTIIGEFVTALDKSYDAVNERFLLALQSARVSAQMFWQTSGLHEEPVKRPKHLKKPKFTKGPKPSRKFRVDETSETLDESETQEEACEQERLAVQQEVKEKLTMDYSTNSTKSEDLMHLPIPPAPFWPLATELSHLEPLFEVEDVLHLGPITSPIVQKD